MSCVKFLTIFLITFLINYSPSEMKSKAKVATLLVLVFPRQSIAEARDDTHFLSS